MNNSAKFQLYPPYSFGGVDFLIVFRKFNLSVVVATKQIERFGLVEDHSTNISVKLLSKYLRWGSNKSQFSLFQL